MRKFIFLALLALALALGFWGCDLLSVSIEDRVYEFVNGLNGTWDTLYENFHPTATTDYDAIKPAGYWSTWFDPTPPDYFITGLDTSDSRNVTATIDGPGGFGGPMLITFRMLQYGNDWFIEEMDLGAYGNIVQ